MSREKIIKNIYDYVVSNYTKINEKDMKMGQLLFNRRCHLNSVQNVYENKSDDVFLCVTVTKEDHNDLIVHCINKKDDYYIDNTYGWYSCKYDYYLIKKVAKNEYEDIDNILLSTKKMLFNINSNSFLATKYFVDHNIL